MYCSAPTGNEPSRGKIHHPTGYTPARTWCPRYRYSVPDAFYSTARVNQTRSGYEHDGTMVLDTRWCAWPWRYTHHVDTEWASWESWRLQEMMDENGPDSASDGQDYRRLGIAAMGPRKIETYHTHAQRHGHGGDDLRPLPLGTWAPRATSYELRATMRTVTTCHHIITVSIFLFRTMAMYRVTTCIVHLCAIFCTIHQCITGLNVYASPATRIPPSKSGERDDPF